MSKPRVIYWFRTDLRLHDSPALKAALDLLPEALFPIWTWDPHYVYRARVGVNRWQYLLDCQNDLSACLTKLNSKQKLLVIREAPQTLLPKLFREWKITHLVYERDTDAYARDRDTLVAKLAKEAGVEVITKTGRTLWDPEDVVKKNGGKPTMSITQVQAAAKKIGDVPRPIPSPLSLPDPGDISLKFAQELPIALPDLNEAYREETDKSYHSLSGPQGDFSPPTLKELGFPPATTPHRGGEKLALATLSTLLANEKYIATFEKPKTAPTDFEPQSTTLLSPHLHFGSLSIRQLYWGVQDIVEKYKGKSSQPPVSLIGQLQFREMYFAAQSALGHSFTMTINNSHCRFIPWHLPTLPPSLSPLTQTAERYNKNNAQAETHFRRWENGQTGFPWIDALMRQLRQEGWIHHLGRHAVACFLTRGGCYVSWERGADVFEELLIDHETASNTGNWQWLSCTAFYAQYYRVYSPIAFGAKTDPDGDFIRKYCPELGKLNKKFIYEPWKAPREELKRAGVRLVDYVHVEGGEKFKLGEGEYVKPMFDFAEQRTRCLEGMKEAYKVGLYGGDERVRDGRWKSLFKPGGVGMLESSEQKSEEGIRELVFGMGKSKDEGSEDLLAKAESGEVEGGEDGAVEEDARGAMEKGGESKGGGRAVPTRREQQQGRKGKRKIESSAGQGTLDGVFKKAKR